MKKVYAEKYGHSGIRITKAMIIFTLAILIMNPVKAQAAKVKLNKSGIIIYVGDSTNLKVSGVSKKVKWSTSKKAVATVSASGTITAKKSGSTTITAKVNKKTLKCKVTVKNPDSLQRLKMAKQQAKKIVKKYISRDMNTAERAYVLYRYLSESCAWQLEQSNAAYKKNFGNEAYAALVMKKAACSGFAKAYVLLCNQANVPVRHTNANSWTHQWNEVRINGKWIKVDTYGGIFASVKGIRKSILRKGNYYDSGEKEKVVFSFTVNI